MIVTKGAPESTMDLCPAVPAQARAVLSAALAEGSRGVAVATRPAPELTTVSPKDEENLHLCSTASTQALQATLRRLDASPAE